MSNLTDLQKRLAELCPSCTLAYNEPLSKHTSFRIGGDAEVMAFPKNVEELQLLLASCASLGISPRILGAGTNVLAPDEGVDGLVICLKDCLEGMVECSEDCIRIFAGVTMTRAAIFAANLGLSGMEFAHGIPGTVGGGVYMNAGAYGGEICQICERVEVMDWKGNIRWLSKEEMAFSYRHSVLEETGEIVVSTIFRLQKEDPQIIRDKMKELMAKRSASQPLDLPSAGSAFKRPVGGYAAALIDGCGLKGYHVGDAAISTKHAGFAVNLGHATAKEVRTLLENVSDIVFENTGIRLEPEVRIW